LQYFCAHVADAAECNSEAIRALCQLLCGGVRTPQVIVFEKTFIRPRA